MLDLFNLSDNTCSLKRQTFYSNNYSTSTGTTFQTWVKPKNTKFVSFFVLGSGGGGGGGQPNTAGTTRRGGAGGGSSSVTFATFPANLLPDILYVSVPAGGRGGTSANAEGTNGSNGGLAHICVSPSISTGEIILSSGDAAAGGGRSGAGGGTAGTAGTPFTNVFSSYLGLVITIDGQIGGAGSTSSVTNRSFSGLTSGGAGGAGVVSAPFSGGSITGIGFIPTIRGGVLSGQSGDNGYASINPSNNITARLPMIFTGGAGGASSNTGIGGGGGDASYGSGGGGAAGGALGTTLPGGRGGDGLVIITSW